MFEFVTPHRLFRTQIHTLRGALPGVLDGIEGSIHEARVATRRIRELLPLLGDRNRRKNIEDLHARFKRLGRSLGRVRDADVRIALLASLEARMPHTAPSLVVLRQQRGQERLTLLRNLIRRLERLEAVRLIEMLDGHRFVVPGTSAWGVDASTTIHARALVAAGALALSSSIYARLR